jgi:hypothetical protein
MTKEERENWRERRQSADDRNSRRAALSRNFDNVTQRDGMRERPLYDPADHDKPGSPARRADLYRATADVAFREQTGMGLDSGLIPSEVGDAMMDDAADTAGDDHAWNAPQPQGE